MTRNTRDAEVDQRTQRETLGHADQAMTSPLHARRDGSPPHRRKVARLVDGQAGS